MQKVFWVLVLFIFHHRLSAQEKGSLHVLNEAKVYIRGTTNVNKFKCELNAKDLADTLLISGSWQGNTVRMEGLDLKIAVEKFDCGLAVMTRDFMDFMQSSRYPEIKLNIEQLIFASNPLEDSVFNLSSIAYLTMAETTLKEKIENGYLLKNGKKQLIGGQHKLKITSFGLTPPSKFMKTVQVQDEISLEFLLTIEEK